MGSNEKVSQEKFDKMFEQMNASWGYEDQALNQLEKELVFKRINNEISDEEALNLILSGNSDNKKMQNIIEAFEAKKETFYEKMLAEEDELLKKNRGREV
ncbi:hypothetical protein BSK59_28910 [Paenibacillus odorifer]|uniref:hypothetical protein n=1 Tax=Paenibacillus odorifer TaxID=189426 RepID=UPI0009700694|nr:hypothetical protein [Paenibacillus odorifer]OME46866.1 hypothetical protein BSK59_28910 [Paenibacillus odorifer]